LIIKHVQQEINLLKDRSGILKLIKSTVLTNNVLHAMLSLPIGVFHIVVRHKIQSYRNLWAHTQAEVCPACKK